MTGASDSAKIAHKELVAVRLANEREVDTTRNFERTCIPGLAQVEGTNPATGDYAFYLTDHLGSTRGLYDSAKARIGGYQFSPYGHVYAAGTFAAATRQYTGHHWDAASALYFAPYRYYSPTMARWLSRDPLGMVDGPNVYAYVRRNPTRFVDILGLSDCDSLRKSVMSSCKGTLLASLTSILSDLVICVKCVRVCVFTSGTGCALCLLACASGAIAAAVITGILDSCCQSLVREYKEDCG